MHSITKFLEAANQNAAEVNRKVVEITQRNLNLGFELAKSLARAAGNPTEIVRVQTSFWRKQFDELATQAEEARNRLFGFNVARPKTLEASPEYAVEEPAKKALTRSQSKGHNRSARDPATASLEQKVGMQTPKTPRFSERAARSGVGSPVGKQPEIQKKDTPKAVQKLPGADSVDEGAKPQTARTVVKPRSASGPAPQSSPADIKFGMLDGNAVRFTNLEAWWLVDGTWRPISPDEVLSNAAVMREARFNQLFPNVPLLPKKAFQSRHR
jgi:hypothetical protein